MRTHGSEPIELLPLAGHRVGGEPALDAVDRPAVLEDPVLRQPADDGFFGAFRETVNRKRVQRLMALMGLDAIFPKPRTTVAAPDTRVYPYLLRDRVLTHVNEVWSSDITYVPMRHGFMYLTAVIDWFSRYVLSWRLSNTLEGQFCLEALDETLSMGRPEIFNTDQGSQFTARDYTSRLEEAGIAVSRDGRGRALDNVFVERLWRSVKYEDIYITDYELRTRARVWAEVLLLVLR